MVDVGTKIQLAKFRIQLMFRDHLDDMFPAHLFKFSNYINGRKKIHFPTTTRVVNTTFR